MHVKLVITVERKTYPYGQFSSAKSETHTLAEIDGDLTEAATVGCLRALADSIEADR